MNTPINEAVEREAFQAALREMRAAFHVNMIRAFQMSHQEVSDAIDKACPLALAIAEYAPFALPPPIVAPVDRRRCKPCAATRGGDTCWKCGATTFEPHPSCGEDPALPPIGRIRELAKEVGYAIGVHGSQQRDFDVIAAPWSDTAIGNHALLEHIAKGLTTGNGPAHIISTERKPLGRYAATIQMDGWYKQLDISVCPNEQYSMPPTTPASAPSDGAARVLDPVVEANRELLHQRSQVGIKKYGVTLGDANLSEPELLTHALQELLDGANYIQALLMRKAPSPEWEALMQKQDAAIASTHTTTGGEKP